MGGETVNRGLDSQKLVVSVMMTSTMISANHSVDEGQQEPNKAPEDQAYLHELDLIFAGVTLNARYGLSDTWGIALSLPARMVQITAGFRDAAGQPMPGYDSIHHRTEVVAGLGDLRLTGHMRALRARQAGQWTLDLTFGVTLPTGGTEPDPFALGEQGENHQHMFFGHGTVDPLVGFELSRLGVSSRFLAFGNARVPLYDNSYGFRGAKSFALGIGADSSLGTKSWRFVGQAGMFHEEPAMWAGRAARNSGRTDVTLTAGVNYVFEGGGALVTLLRYPINLQASGGQMSLGPVVTVGYATNAGLGGS